VVVNLNKKVVCHIQAFACEETIAAAMQSVLNQTYANWVCFVLSNGNNAKIDGSYGVIKDFAAKDGRFVVLNRKYNDLDMYIPAVYRLAQMFPSAYVCVLDADDEYEPDFFERAVTFAEENDLDAVACGTALYMKESVGSEEKTLMSKRQIGENLIVRRGDFTGLFTEYRSFFNEMWGKLYRTDLFQNRREFDKKRALRRFIGRFLPDSLFCLDALSHCGAVGVLSGTSHKFYHFLKRPAHNATALANASAANGRTFRQRFGRAYYGQVFSVYDTYGTFVLY
jgi:glycosyltransferase involved in cell wall biosynthesis